LTKQTFKGLIKSNFKWCNCLPTQTKISQASWSNCGRVNSMHTHVSTHTRTRHTPCHPWHIFRTDAREI